jgi:solute carrier family 12 sodium/potassium/chloride transporter 2
MVDQVQDSHNAAIVKFGMVKGVYIPTLLTILGVIMYLRLGWVVGNVGLLGAWIIIFIAFTITAATALSMSSIITNIRIGPGGAYSIISRSLGLEIGGSIGVPLYLSITFSIVLYIFGFREGMLFLFPDLSPLLVDLAIFAALFVIVFISTEIAFRIQFIILAIIIGSLFSVFAAGIASPPSFDLVIEPTEASFWIVFAVFFPAATGIMAGANMSGELENPRRSIPFGTLAAIATSLFIYLILAYWLGGTASSEELIGNYTIMIENAAINELVLAGLLAATFSSALNSFVGASRVLQAMAEHNILPHSKWFAQRESFGIPRNAIIFTAAIALATLMLRELNIVAPLITMFFLITYAMINIVILIEQSLGLASFRPILKIPRFVPFIGTVGALFTMFIINSTFSLIAVIMVATFYYLLMYRHLERKDPYGDVRSSLFVALAEWAAKKSMNLPASQARAWRPNLLLPVDFPAEIRGVAEFIRDITYPHGSINMLGINLNENRKYLESGLPLLTGDFQEDGIYTTWTIVNADGFDEGAIASMQTLKRALFSPNIIFLRMSSDPKRRKEVTVIMSQATENLMGVVLYAGHPRAGLGRRRNINLWICEDCMKWTPGKNLPNCDLAILMAYKLRINWDAKLTVLAAISDAELLPGAKGSLDTLIDYARLPVHTVTVIPSDLMESLDRVPQADLNIFSLPPDPDFEEIWETVQKTRSTCLFCRDSTEEDALI